jgi:hypothetical protein
MVVAALVLVTVSILVARCDTTAQFAPSLPQVVGLQVDGDRLTILTGAPCPDVTRIVVSFRGNGDAPSRRTQLTAVTPTTVDQIAVGDEVTVPGFETSEALPTDFDWRDHAEMDVTFDGRVDVLGVASSLLGPVKKAGAKHEGDGTAYVRGEGWLTPAQITAGDAKDFLTACTPDPAKK